MENNGHLLKLSEVAEYLSVGKTSIYSLMKNQGFPKPIKLTGKGTNRWYKKDVVAWVKGRRHAG